MTSTIRKELPASTALLLLVTLPAQRGLAAEGGSRGYLQGICNDFLPWA